MSPCPLNHVELIDNKCVCHWSMATGQIVAAAELKAARAVRDALLTKSAVGIWATDGVLREIIEKARREDAE